MSDAAIKAALAKATRAAAAATPRCDISGMAVPCSPGCDCAKAAPAAIAAFLRAVPERTEAGGPALYHSAGLAAAVERAAGGGAE